MSPTMTSNRDPAPCRLHPHGTCDHPARDICRGHGGLGGCCWWPLASPAVSWPPWSPRPSCRPSPHRCAGPPPSPCRPSPPSRHQGRCRRPRPGPRSPPPHPAAQPHRRDRTAGHQQTDQRCRAGRGPSTGQGWPDDQQPGVLGRWCHQHPASGDRPDDHGRVHHHHHRPDDHGRAHHDHAGHHDQQRAPDQRADDDRRRADQHHRVGHPVTVGSQQAARPQRSICLCPWSACGRCPARSCPSPVGRTAGGRAKHFSCLDCAAAAVDGYAAERLRVIPKPEAPPPRPWPVRYLDRSLYTAVAAQVRGPGVQPCSRRFDSFCWSIQERPSTGVSPGVLGSDACNDGRPANALHRWWCLPRIPPGAPPALGLPPCRSVRYAAFVSGVGPGCRPRP